MTNKYKEAGVDIEAGNAFVQRLMKKAPAIGGFGGMFRVPDGYEKPVMVSGADGVGTKINICKVSGIWSKIGIDLVAMCVNDVITSGAKPLYFLDYISTGRLSPVIDQIMVGILEGCEIADIELIGGETAEHPRHAPPHGGETDIDLAGFCTGIVEETEIIDGSIIKPGDKIIGIASSGLHSNGYSLINDMLWRHKISWKDSYIGEGTPELITPTTIYASTVKRLTKELPILGMAHITGGGLEENVARCIPKGLKAHIDWNSWPLPDIFSKIMLKGEIPEEDMKSTFNMGIGFCVIVPPEVAKDVMILSDHPSQIIGHIHE